jgi:hypothetical protein
VNRGGLTNRIEIGTGLHYDRVVPGRQTIEYEYAIDVRHGGFLPDAVPFKPHSQSSFGWLSTRSEYPAFDDVAAFATRQAT